MSEPLPVIFTKNFQNNISLIPAKDRKRILEDLTHLNHHDVLRQGRLQGELNYLRKMNNGDYRIFLAYCAECYHEFKYRIKCSICNEEDLERIIVFFLYPRKKLYQPKKFQRVDIRKIKF